MDRERTTSPASRVCTLLRTVLHVSIIILISIPDGSLAKSCTLREHLPCTYEGSNNDKCSALSSHVVGSSWPGPPAKLHIASFKRKYYADSSTEYPGLNISWLIPPNESFRQVKGFTVKLLALRGRSTVNRAACYVFNLSDANWTDQDLHDQPQVLVGVQCHDVIITNEINLFGLFVRRKQIYRLRYNLTLYPITQNETYYVEVSSLPRPPPNIEQPSPFYHVTTSLSEDINDRHPANWLSSIRVRNDSQLRTVTVEFDMADDAYGFRKYEVMLVKDNSWNKLIEKKIVESYEEPEVTFTDVKPGAYKIWLNPSEIFKDDPFKCVCYSKINKNTRRRECKDYCAHTKSLVFIIAGTNTTSGLALATSGSVSKVHASAAVTRPKETGQVASSPSSNVDQTTIKLLGRTDFGSLRSGGATDQVIGERVGLALGVIVLVLISALLFYVYWTRKKKVNDPEKHPVEKYTPTDSGKNGDVLEKYPVEKYTPTDRGKNVDSLCKSNIVCRCLAATVKNVLIIYSNDHELHTQVVEKLARFLARVCNCNVILDLWCTKEIMELNKGCWLERHISKADKVLIISSEGAFKKYRCWQEKKKFPSMDEAPRGDMFTGALVQIKGSRMNATDNSKYIDAYFCYTAKKYVFGHSIQYKLMQCIEELVFTIHDMTKSSCNVENEWCHINHKGYTHFEEGVDLQKAINNMKEMIQLRPQWFEELYGEPVSTDSGVESYSSLLASDTSVSCNNSFDSSQLVAGNLASVVQENGGLEGLPMEPADIPHFFPPVDPCHISISTPEAGIFDIPQYSESFSPLYQVSTVSGNSSFDFVPPVLQDDSLSITELVMQINRDSPDAHQVQHMYDNMGVQV